MIYRILNSFLVLMVASTIAWAANVYLNAATTPAGLNVNISAGAAANATAAGGSIDLQAADGGGTSGNGGALTIETGNSTSGDGGIISALAGNGGGSGTGGNYQFTAGDGGATGTGGGFRVDAGAGGATSGNGGAITLGAGNATTSGNGGDLVLTAGLGAGAGVPGKVKISGPVADGTFAYSTPSTGFSLTLDNGVWHTIINPAGTLLAGTIVMPPAPINGQIVNVRSSQVITGLTVSPNSGQSILGNPTTLAVGGIFECIYRATGTTWFC